MADTLIQPEVDANAGTLELKDNTIIVVLGASGDLAKKKTFPALFGLFRNNFLPANVKIVGYARTKMDREEYLKRVKSYIKTPTKEMEEQLEEFTKFCTYVSGQYDQDESFINLRGHLEELEKGRSQTHRVFYMALPPSVFITVSQHLKRNCYPKNGIARVIVEKPFGKDLQSSRELQRALAPDWKEEELFRIDHYLGKEMVKNILILRFGNEFFGATWNRNHIDNVQISFKEPFGTEGRGGYFDEFGIIRDVMQNHLLQVLTLLTMERPISFSAEDIRDEKVRVLRAMPSIEPKNVIIGQYGKSLDGSKPGYKEDDTVPKDSRCPTFASMVAYIKNERWDGVPFILKAGKALNEQKTCTHLSPSLVLLLPSCNLRNQTQPLSTTTNMASLSLTGKIALVTGASKGIGRATALALGAAGASVVVNYNSDEASAAELVQKLGEDKAYAVKADAGSVAGAAELVQATVKRFGRIDVLVANAGVLPMKDLANTTEADFDAAFNLNVKGPYFLCQHAVPHMSSGSHIVLLSTTLTTASTVAPPYLLYNSTKGAVEQITRVLSKDLGRKGIFVNAVAPGPTGTELFYRGKSEEMLKMIAGFNPFNRIGTPEDVASTIVYLSSAPWVSGQIVRVNGGMA